MKSFKMENGKVVRPPDREALIKMRGKGTMQTLGTTSEFLKNGLTVADLLMSGILARFPKLNFASVETGVGWVPFVLESLDKHAIKYRVQDEHPEMTELPSFYFHRQVYANCWYEHLTDYHMEMIGADNILFETDFPHPTCLIGDEINDAIEVVTGALSKEDQEKILWKNATKLFKLDS
jgi:predicted TIM-barrel fold metal-dependent hydrolase